MLARADAALVIGDPALAIDAAAAASTRLDLGSEWHALTGLPFVYAMWSGRSGRASAGPVRGAAGGTRPRRRRDLAAIAARSAGGDRRASRGRLTYLRDNLKYGFGEREIAGLRRFHELASKWPGRGAAAAVLFMAMDLNAFEQRIERRPASPQTRRCCSIASAPTYWLGRMADASAPRKHPEGRRHLHHRPQRQLHERLRGALQLLRVLPRSRSQRRATCSASTRSSRRSTRRSRLAVCSCCCKGGHNPDLPLRGTKTCFAR